MDSFDICLGDPEDPDMMVYDLWIQVDGAWLRAPWLNIRTNSGCGRMLRGPLYPCCTRRLMLEPHIANRAALSKRSCSIYAPLALPASALLPPPTNESTPFVRGSNRA
jgi:hypothetical protein